MILCYSEKSSNETDVLFCVEPMQDLSNTNCADSYQGGWWYSHCQHVNINGKYALGLTWYDSLENEWIALAKVEMKIRDKRIFNH